MPMQAVAHLDHWSSSPVNKHGANPYFYTDGTGQMEILTGQLMSLGTGEFKSCGWKVGNCPTLYIR